MIVVGGRKDYLEQQKNAAHEHLDQKDFALPPETLEKMKEEGLQEKNVRPRVRRLQQVEEQEEEVFDDLDLEQGEDLVDDLDNEDLNEASNQEAEELQEEDKYEEEQKEEEDDDEGEELLDNDQEEFDEEIEDETREEDNHFSYYAFEGHTGAIRWKHEPLDYADLNDPAYDPERSLNKFLQSTSHVRIRFLFHVTFLYLPILFITRRMLLILI